MGWIYDESRPPGADRWVWVEAASFTLGDTDQASLTSNEQDHTDPNVFRGEEADAPVMP